MSRPATRSELINVATENYEKMNTLISSLTDTELATPFDFAGDGKKKEAHWKRDKNLRDILIHLYEWHQLLLHWIGSNQKGDNVPFLPKPYNWKTYGNLNLAETFSDEELFSKGIYQWVGGSTLGSYFTSVTASHYDWAVKKLKAHRKNCQSR